MKALTFTSSLACAAALALPGHATLIASDSFHTTDPQDPGTYAVDRLMTQNPTSGVYGFSGGWSTSWNHTGDLAANTGGLTHNMVGGAMAGHAYTTTGPSGRQVFRALDYSASGVSATAESDYYFSFAMSTSNADRIAGFGLRGTESWSSGSGSVMDAGSTGGTGYGLNNTDLVGISVGFENDQFAVWVNGNKTAITSSGATAGDTYFTLVHIENTGDTGNDTVNISIYDASQTLDDLASPFASVSVTDQDVTGKLWNLSPSKLPASESDGDGEVYFDEFRYGTSIESVAVPEPGSVAILGLGGLALLARRRQRA